MATSPIDQNTLLQIAQQKAQQTNPAFMPSPNPVLNQIRQQPQQPAPLQIQHPDANAAPPTISAQPQAMQTAKLPSRPLFPRGTLEGDQAHLNTLIQNKPALENVYGDITQSSLGKAHPILGKILGGLAQVPASIADIGLSAAVPRVASLVPGTSANQAARVQNNMGLIKEEGAQREQAARTQSEQAHAGLYGEQAAAAHTTPATAEEAVLYGVPEGTPLNSVLRERLAQNKQTVTGRENVAQTGAASHITGAEIAADAKRDVAAQKPPPGGVKGDLQQQLSDEEAKPHPDKAKIANLTKRLKDIDPLGEQRITVQVAGQNAANQRATDTRTEREYQAIRSRFDKDAETYEAQKQKLQEAGLFIGRGAMGDALGAVKSLSGLASGQGSGVRITQAELNSIVHARGYGGDFQAWLQKFGDGRSLTRGQEAEIKDILNSVERVSNAKETVINKILDDLGNANDIPGIRKIYSQGRHALGGF